ncbi:MAG: long-chain fatty acid--CoA ligase, partial [Vicinamibacterales bacterium]
MDTRPWHRHYDAGVPPALTFDERPLPALFHQSAERFPDAPAIIFRNRTLTYRDVRQEVATCAAALAGLGVTPGARVAIHLPNIPQTVIAYYAVLSLGGVVVMTNPLYVEREIEHQWNDAGCTVAITTDIAWVRRLRSIRDRLPVRHYVLASIPEYFRQPLRTLAGIALRFRRPPLVASVSPGPGLHLWRDLLKGGVERPDAAPAAAGMDDLAVLQYTGGTTGVPKAAMLTHGNLSHNAQQIAAWFVDARPGHEVMLGCLPIFHVFGMTVAMNFPLVIGGAIVLMPDPRDIPALIDAIARHKVTLFPGVPQMFGAIVHSAAAARADLTSVTSCFSGAAPMPKVLLERFEAMTGSRIVEGFGLTEASPVTHINPLKGQRKVGSVGVPCPGTDMRLVSLEDGVSPVAAGAEGELLVSGPQVMQGYWNRPDETATVLADGWLRTGDIARVDEEGYTFIVGRKKDMIIAGGYNIYPDEVDAVLLAHPAVRDAATIGVPDERRGENVKSFVVLKPGQSVTADDIIR